MEKKASADLLKQIESGYSLPSLSPVAMRLVEIASDDTCSAEELAAVIERDPSLAVRVLTLANSAFFQTRQSTTSLRQAVVKLGFQRLRIMALSLSLRDTFPMGKMGPLDYEELWHTTLYRAFIAKSFAAHLKNCHPEEAFVAGLIMEIGLLILFDLRIKWDTEVPPIRLEPLEELLTWERDRYGIDHRQVGEAALRVWKFPKIIVQCQLLYGQAALSQDAPLLAKIYELSREFSRLISQEPAGFHALFKEGERFLGLHRDVINDILLATFDEVQDIADNLNVELNQEGISWRSWRRPTRLSVRSQRRCQRTRRSPTTYRSPLSIPWRKEGILWNTPSRLWPTKSVIPSLPWVALPESWQPPLILPQEAANT